MKIIKVSRGSGIDLQNAIEDRIVELNQDITSASSVDGMNYGTADEMLSAFKSALRQVSDVETTTNVYADETSNHTTDDDEYLDAVIDELDSAPDFNYSTVFRKTPLDLKIYITDYDDGITEFAVPYTDLSFNDIEGDVRYIIDEINALFDQE